MRAGLAAAAALLVFEAVPLLAVLGLGPPEPSPFAGRAMGHVRAIARRPHPPGTEEHGRVREYLLGVLRELGLEPRTHVVPVPPLVNLLGRLPGRRGGRAVLLAAHYDSVPQGPGAGDDAAAVAALLETARALKAGPPLANDVILLLTDGEELGLRGARAFAAEHPWAKEVGLVLNFEARGNSGPSIMFETSDGNARLVSEFLRAAPWPVASSLSAAVYRLLPNDTDFTALKEAGLRGLNFAFIDGARAYHTPEDTPENLSLRSLEHHGSYALALTRRFGDLDLEALGDERDSVYFPLFGRHYVRYPSGWAPPIAAFVLLAFTAVLAAGHRRGLLALAGCLRGLRGALSSFIGVACGLTLAAWAALLLSWDRLPSPAIVLGLWNVALAATLLDYRRRWRRLRVGETAAGAVALWMLPLAASSLLLPGGSYLFAWPVLAGAASLAVTLLLPERRAGLRAAALLLLALPVLLILVPTAYLLFLAFSREATVGALAALAFETLALELLLPQLRLLLPGILNGSQGSPPGGEG